jgi:hypothetical protein
VTAQSTWKKSQASIVVSLGAEELPPGRPVCSDGSRRDPEAPQNASDRRRADAAADLQQLALDPLVAPRRVLPSELLNQGRELGVDGRPPRPVRVGPLLRDEVAMPAQDRGGCDQPMRE